MRIRLFAIALLPLLALGCERESPARRDLHRTIRNAVLIVVDTLRRDHLGAYGYARDTSPAIDALAAEGIRFERAYSTSSWTAPSVASMLTGLYPSAHRVVRPKTALPEAVATLPETLRQAGFATAGVVSNRIIGRRNGFDRGFDWFDQEQAKGGHDYESTEGVSETAIRFLQKLSSSEQPFFLFVHFFDPHYSYRRHPEAGFAAERVGRLDGDEAIQELRRLGPILSDNEIAFLRDLYDEEIHYTDRGVARLIATLQELGHNEDTLIVFTADHGEEFLERGWLGHTRTLYDELVRVPLILRMPGPIVRSVIAEPVSLTSLPATILELLGLDVPEAYRGESLVPLLADPSAVPRDGPLIEVDFAAALAQNAPKTAKKQALVEGRFKIIRDELAQSIELYDVVSDPGERTDLAASQPLRRQALSEALDARFRALEAGRVEERFRDLSEDELSELRALGYGN